MRAQSKLPPSPRPKCRARALRIARGLREHHQRPTKTAARREGTLILPRVSIPDALRIGLHENRQPFPCSANLCNVHSFELHQRILKVSFTISSSSLETGFRGFRGFRDSHHNALIYPGQQPLEKSPAGHPDKISLGTSGKSVQQTSLKEPSGSLSHPDVFAEKCRQPTLLQRSQLSQSLFARFSIHTRSISTPQNSRASRGRCSHNSLLPILPSTNNSVVEASIRSSSSNRSLRTTFARARLTKHRTLQHSRPIAPRAFMAERRTCQLSSIETRSPIAFCGRRETPVKADGPYRLHSNPGVGVGKEQNDGASNIVRNGSGFDFPDLNNSLAQLLGIT